MRRRLLVLLVSRRPSATFHQSFWTSSLDSCLKAPPPPPPPPASSTNNDKDNINSPCGPSLSHPFLKHCPLAPHTAPCRTKHSTFPVCIRRYACRRLSSILMALSSALCRTRDKNWITQGGSEKSHARQSYLCELCTMRGRGEVHGGDIIREEGEGGGRQQSAWLFVRTGSKVALSMPQRPR